MIVFKTQVHWCRSCKDSLCPIKKKKIPGCVNLVKSCSSDSPDLHFDFILKCLFKYVARMYGILELKTSQSHNHRDSKKAMTSLLNRNLDWKWRFVVEKHFLQCIPNWWQLSQAHDEEIRLHMCFALRWRGILTEIQRWVLEHCT